MSLMGCCFNGFKACLYRGSTNGTVYIKQSSK